MKKILFFGGMNSGKSKLAEEKTLQIAKEKPYYIATYKNDFDDKLMHEKILEHQKRREQKFINIEENYDISKVIKEGKTYIVDCLSMLVFNNLKNEQSLFLQFEKLFTCKANIVFVLNDTSCGIIPMDKQSRDFVTLSAKVGQVVAQMCDEVYEVKYGIKKQLK